MTPPGQDVPDASLPPATIAGIAIGVLLLFILAALLFLIYHRRERVKDRIDDDASSFETGRSSRRECRERGLSGESRLFGPEYEVGTYTRYLDNSIPTHPAYIPSAVWPGPRPPSGPPLPPSQPAPVRSNRPDSYAVQAYLAAAAESARLADPPPPVHQKAERPRSRSLGLSLAIPKKPTRVETGYPGLPIHPAVRSHQQLRQDTPAVVPFSQRQQVYRNDAFVEVPLRSGKSTLYGY
ncbi:LPXTG-domain-containing protein [Ophiocordyceps camponoti-floridani]|uniref:LPXTG-domain-containing protein n=1 Tax=Ophiocordyceps camponoti-floridani TaxID=2030778 RepID=A0A8H4Q4X4_9HYPO|nr:LPXTG-domain-containing protein [Ophiocordyceps camponoti-floridani]